jgi:hypothetical protein
MHRGSWDRNLKHQMGADLIDGRDAPASTPITQPEERSVLLEPPPRQKPAPLHLWLVLEALQQATDDTLQWQPVHRTGGPFEERQSFSMQPPWVAFARLPGP